MTDVNSGRPPLEAFHTVTDADQARILSDPKSFEFFRPFVAREGSVKDVADQLGIRMDTLLYRVRTFHRAGLLEVSRLERRAGRPIKLYRSVHDAYFIPFNVTPFADTEERLRGYFDKRAEFIVPRMAQVLRKTGREGRRIYRNANNDEVWSESASEVATDVNLYDAESYQRYMETYRGQLAEFMDDRLSLRDEDAKAFLTDLYEVWRRYKQKEAADAGNAYFFQFTLVPETI